MTWPAHTLLLIHAVMGIIPRIVLLDTIRPGGHAEWRATIQLLQTNSTRPHFATIYQLVAADGLVRASGAAVMLQLVPREISCSTRTCTAPCTHHAHRLTESRTHCSRSQPTQAAAPPEQAAYP